MFIYVASKKFYQYKQVWIGSTMDPAMRLHRHEDDNPPGMGLDLVYLSIVYIILAWAKSILYA
jgi:hypothetical protein